MNGSPATIAEIEKLLEDSIQKIELINKGSLKMQTTMALLPGMNETMKALASAQTMMTSNQHTMAEAAKSMADTFSKSEKRQTNLETTNVKLYESKGVPATVFTMVVATLLIFILMLGAWITKLNVDASLTDFKLKHGEIKPEEKVKGHHGD